MQRPVLWAALLLCCAVLFGYSLFRIVNLSFVHDESLTYTILIGDSSFRDMANHHPLNTRFMGWTLHWFGDREWSLRLPNLIAHALYLVSGMLFLRMFRNPSVILLGFALLNLNPFLLDFFGLARGYGIAVAFSLTCLLLFRKAWDRPGTTGGKLLIFASFTFAALADLANFAWLNFHLAMLAGAAAFWFQDYRASRQGARRSLIFAGMFFAANIWSIINVARRVLDLRRNGQLYVGGDRGFIPDTLGSLVFTYLYDASYTALAQEILQYSILGAVVVVGLHLIYRMFRDRHAGFSQIVFAMLVLSSLLPIAEHYLFNTPFPQDRTALLYVSLFALTIISTVSDVNAHVLSRVLSLVCLALGAAMLAHFARTANLTHTLVWRYDADTKAVLADIEKLPRGSSQKLSIGNDWVLAPSINYYQMTRHQGWLEPATRDGPASRPYDVVVCVPEDLGNVRSRYSLVKQYPTSGMSLLVANNAAITQ